MRTIGTVLLLLTFVCPGCGSYWGDRLGDFDQCFLVAGYAGLGAVVDAKVGPFDTGLGAAGAYAAGKPHWWAWDSSFMQL